MIIVDAEAQLLEVVGALGAASGLAGRLHRRQEQSDEDRDNGYDDEKLDQRKRTTRMD